MSGNDALVTASEVIAERGLSDARLRKIEVNALRPFIESILEVLGIRISDTMSDMPLADWVVASELCSGYRAEIRELRSGVRSGVNQEVPPSLLVHMIWWPDELPIPFFDGDVGERTLSPWSVKLTGEITTTDGSSAKAHHRVELLPPFPCRWSYGTASNTLCRDDGKWIAASAVPSNWHQQIVDFEFYDGVQWTAEQVEAMRREGRTTGAEAPRAGSGFMKAMNKEEFDSLLAQRAAGVPT